MTLYEIAFSAELIEGAEERQVRANLTRLFQADERRIAQLFSGRRVIIKNRLDAAAAEKYRAALAQAGARVEVVPMPDVEEIELASPPVEPSKTPAPVSEAAPTATRVSVAPRDEVMAAFANVDAPDFGLAPVGADLQDPAAEVAPPALDLSRYTLAPAGSDIGEATPEAPAPVPDTSHLKLL
ncbi:hypothetical protein IQ22_02891 [Pseudomonas duriflava]|uniref:Uncharacterized protein n=1 Tax=Pseudomonas duriflava TaxID=459528 RepID=A0A562Q8I3_9PSED|nr:hypothetical protein [Pseudomonas duriflava]TWI53052.1 hypothetical protein IQ22_02891 [Pseudomonas duriflava]